MKVIGNFVFHWRISDFTYFTLSMNRFNFVLHGKSTDTFTASYTYTSIRDTTTSDITEKAWKCQIPIRV